MNKNEQLDLKLKANANSFINIQKHFDTLISNLNNIIESSKNIKILLKQDDNKKAEYIFLNNIPIKLELINKMDIGIIIISFLHQHSNKYMNLNIIIKFDNLGNIIDYKSIDSITEDDIVREIIETLIINKDTICDNSFKDIKDCISFA